MGVSEDFAPESGRSRLGAQMRRIFRPLARLMIAREFRYPEAAETLKLAFAEAAEDHKLDGKRLTDSRASVLTGLQRRDLKRLRGAGAATPKIATAGPLSRVIGAWLGDRRYRDEGGAPRPLPRDEGPGEASFAELAAEVSSDVHARTILDELLRQGLVTIDPDNRIRLLTEAFVPRAGSEEIDYFLGANLGDHAEASTANMLAPGDPPFFERAVYYNRLTRESAEELERLARKALMDAMLRVNEAAKDAQMRDRDAPGATHRFRLSGYVYRADEAEGGSAR